MKSGSPFDCARCTDKDRDGRNCLNTAGLSDGARAVESYSLETREELLRKGASKVFTLGPMRLYECPMSYVTDESIEMIRAVYLANDSGHLLFAGGWADQPLWFVQAYEIFKEEKAARQGDEANV